MIPEKPYISPAVLVCDYSLVPDEIEESARRYGELYDISPELLIAIAKAESEFDPGAINGSCVGLMQVSLKWHRDRMDRLDVSEEQMWTVDGSMHVATDYLSELFAKYEDPAMVLMVYNGDDDAWSYWEGGCAMSDYAAEVLSTAKELEEVRDANSSTGEQGRTGEALLEVQDRY